MEKWKVIDYYRKISFDEGIKPGSGRVKVALIYPNIYEIAIQNLGYQYVYSELNKLRDVVCERFVLDFYEDNLSIENQRFLQEFDIIAVSINYEEDVLNLIKFLYLQKIPVFSEDRGCKYPPIISGGALGLINPNILKDIVDVQLLGDFKPMLDIISEYFINFEKKDIFIEDICKCDFAFHKNKKVMPKPIIDNNPVPIFSQIKPCKGEFKEIFLLEASKSCKYNCRFCTTGYNLRPYRKIETQKIIETIKNQRYSDHIGIISAAFGDISNLNDILEFMIENNLKISVSSLRVDSITEDLIERLKSLGVRSITIAEETASEKLKKMIGKNIKKESIFSAVEKIAKLGIENLKLYYMIGFYGENEDDVREIIFRIDKICSIFKEYQKKGYNRLGKIKASINIFNPKPFTPMQFFGLIGKDEYEKKLKILSHLKKIGNLKIDVMPYNQAVLQTTIAKAEDNIVDFYKLYIDSEFNQKKALKMFDNSYIYRNYGYNDILPWDNIIYPNISRDIINMEYKRCLQVLKDYSR